MNEWIEILMIMENYPNLYNKDYPFWADHDVIGLNLDWEDVSEIDMYRLNELGVFYSDHYDSLIKFV